MRPTLAGIVVFGVLALVYVLAPRRLAGEQPDAELKGTGAPLCAACPWEQQITGVGLEQAGDRAWLTTRFAAPPVDAHYSLVLAGSTPIALRQTSAQTWSLSAPPGSVVPLESFRVAMRDDRVVWELPSALAMSGLAIVSSTGRRFPESSVMAPSNPPPPAANIVDLGVALLVTVGVLVGCRRGFAAAAGQVIAFAAVLVLSRALFVPVQRLAGTEVAPAMVFICTLAATAAAVSLAALALRNPMVWLARAAQRVSPIASSACAIVASVVASTAATAMVLALASDLVLFDAAHRTIQASPTAQTLITGWNAVFPPLG